LPACRCAFDLSRNSITYLFNCVADAAAKRRRRRRRSKKKKKKKEELEPLTFFALDDDDAELKPIRVRVT
jgi:hypothetical protein